MLIDERTRAAVQRSWKLGGLRAVGKELVAFSSPVPYQRFTCRNTDSQSASQPSGGSC